MANLANALAVLLLVVAIVACSAERPRFRQVRKFQQLQQRRPLRLQPVRKLARQQEPVTPYPNAEELIPDVPFEEGSIPPEGTTDDGRIPDEVYGPPDETYGTPEEEPATADQLPSEEAPAEFAPNADVEEFQVNEIDEIQQPAQPISRLTRRRKTKNQKIVASRLMQKKKNQKSQRLTVPVSAAIPLPFAAQFAAVPQQYFVVNQQPFALTSQYQAW